MANKKKKVEEKDKKKKVEEKEIKKSKKVVEEDLEEIDVEEYDDEDYEDELEEVENESETKEVTKALVDPNTEIRVMKLLSAASICVSAVTLIVLLIILGKVSTIASNYEVDTDNEQDEEEYTYSDYDVSMFKEISFSDFKDWMEDSKNSEVRFVYTGRSNCSYCLAMLPSLQQSVEEYDYTLYYLDLITVVDSTSSIYDKENAELLAEIREMSDVFTSANSYLGSTPMVYAIKKGKVIDVNAGYTEYSTYQSFLEDNGVKER